jgi:alpha-tubulin suppressor-like RCC1 family protein
MHRTSSLVLIVGVAACSSSSAPRTASKFAVVSGQGQSAVVGTQLPDPLVVKVTDSHGDPVQGQAVNFIVTSGGGSVFGGAETTDNAGIAQERWTLGTSTADSQRVEARAVDPSTGQPLTFGVFHATALSAAPESLTVVAGNNQSATISTALPDSIAVRAKDKYGNLASGDTVHWAVTAGGSTVSPSASVTNAAGIAKAQWTMGPASTANALTATVGNLPPVYFAAAATAGTTNPAMAAFISAGAGSACALTASGVAYCWGVDQEGEDGTGFHGNPSQFAPVAVPVTTHFTSIANSRFADLIIQSSIDDDVRGYTCATATDGTGYCWGGGGPMMGRGPGRYAYPLLSNDPNNPSPAPAPVVGGIQFSSIVAGYWMACGLDMAGTAYCWGAEPYVGDGVTVPADSNISQGAPVAVAGGYHFQQLVIGQYHACGLVSDGTAYCWGSNQYGEIGDGTTTFRNAPVQVSTSLRFTSLSAGGVSVSGDETCGLTASGDAYCWGEQSQSTPTLVPGGYSFSGIFMGDGTTCGITGSGVYCWGVVYWTGGSQNTVTTPVAAPSLPGVTFQSLAGGDGFFCGRSTTNGLYCWGNNMLGQLGVPAATPYSTTLVAVTPFSGSRVASRPPLPRRK